MSKKGAARALEIVRPRSKTIGVKIDADLVDEARAAASILGGFPHQMTLARLVAEALRPHLERLRREHNHGRPFWPPPDRMRLGRPLKIRAPK